MESNQDLEKLGFESFHLKPVKILAYQIKPDDIVTHIDRDLIKISVSDVMEVSALKANNVLVKSGDYIVRDSEGLYWHKSESTFESETVRRLLD